jgi:hypothetical protein
VPDDETITTAGGDFRSKMSSKRLHHATTSPRPTTATVVRGGQEVFEDATLGCAPQTQPRTHQVHEGNSGSVT